MMESPTFFRKRRFDQSPLFRLGIPYFFLALISASLLFFQDFEWVTLVGMGILIGQFLLYWILAALLGRSWLTGLLSVLSLCIPFTLIILAPLSKEIPSGHWESNLSLLFCVPGLVLAGALPLLALRSLLGWRLILPEETLPNAGRFTVADIVWVTSTIASILYLYRVPAYAFDIPLYGYFKFAIPILLTLVALGTCLGVPAAWLAFGTHRNRLRFFLLPIVFLIGFGGLFTFVFQTQGRAGSTQFLLLIPATTAMLTFTLGIGVLRKCGLQWATSQSSRRSDPTDTKHVVGDQLASAFHRRSAIGLLAFTILVSLAISVVQYRQASHHRWLIELKKKLQSNGGYLKLKDGYVTEVKLGPKSKGSELQSLPDLPHLKKLDLSWTLIQDGDLRQLHRFQALQSLNLDGTQISQMGIKEALSLPRLRELHIADTPLTFPDLMIPLPHYMDALHIGGLLTQEEDLISVAEKWEFPSTLQGIGMQGKQIQDSWMISLLTMPQFITNGWGKKDFFLSETSTTGNFLDYQTDFYDQLTLEDAPITDPIFAKLTTRDKIRVLRLRNTELTDASIPIIVQLIQSKFAFPNYRGTELVLGEGKITEEGIAQSKLDVQVLRLQAKQFTGRTFRNWKPTVSELDLSDSGITDETVSNLANLQLQNLSLARTAITNRSLPLLARLQAETLDLSDTPITANGILEAGFGGQQSLTVSLGQFSAEELQRLKVQVKILIQ